MTLIARFIDGPHAIELDSINSKTVVQRTVAISSTQLSFGEL